MEKKVNKKYTNLEDTFSITMELQKPLLKDEDDKDYENEEKIKYREYKSKKNIQIVLSIISVFFLYSDFNSWIR